MNTTHRLCLILILIWTTLLIGEADYQMITDLGTSAKTIGLGMTQGTYDGSTNVFENPASITPEQSTSVSVFYSSIMNEVSYTALSVSTKLPVGSIGLGYMQASIPDITATNVIDGSYVQLGTFDYLNYVLKLSYQYNFTPHLSGGLSAVYYKQEFYDISGTGYNADIGLRYTSDFQIMSIFARNIIPNSDVVYEDDSKELLPFDIVGSYRLKLQHISPSIQLSYRNNTILRSAGMSMQLPNIDFITFNIGYTQYIVLEDINEKASGGVSLEFPYLKLDYAYVKSDYIANDDNHFMSIGLSF